MASTVTWTLVAQHQLTDIWIESNRRREISEAADRIDVLLQNDPATVGESRSGDQRVLFEFPLLLVYEILQQDRLVRIAVVRELAAK